MLRLLVLIGSVVFFAVACGRPVDTDLSDYAPAVPTPAPVATLANHWTVALDPGMSADEAEAVAGAVGAWQRALAATCPIEVALVVGDVDTRADLLAIAVRVGDPGGARLGRTDDRRIVIRPQHAFDFGVAARHELGHAFGLDHAGRGIMEESTTAHGVGEEDAAAYAAKRCGR